MFCVSIELDDEQSDAESTDSTPDAFANIPLPSPTISMPTLPHTSSTNNSSPALDAIPLPKCPVDEKSVADSHISPSALETGGHRSKVDADTKTDDSSSSTRGGDAVHAKTSIGTITVLLNRKLGPRLSKASIFDVPDDNVKEVNRKLLKLRRLKRMKKNKDGVTELEGGSATGRKALQQRISEWKEELLNDQNFKKSKHYDSRGGTDTAANRTVIEDTKGNQKNTATEDGKTEAKDHISAQPASGIKTEEVDTKLVPSLKSDDSYMMKLYDTFTKVSSCNDAVQLDWPREMVQETVLAPKIVYSCNPLYFNFRKLQSGMQQNDGNVELRKHRHKKKRKKGHTGKTDDHTASSKAVQKDVSSSDVNKGNPKSSKKIKSASQIDATKEHTKKHKSLLDHGISGKKAKKSAAKTDKPRESDTSTHLAQSNKSQKHVSDSHSQCIQPTVADDALARLAGAVKDTDKSRWDTSSDSEMETTQQSTTNSKIVKSRVPASADQSSAKTIRHHSRSRSMHWSSDGSARSQKRSRYRSTSSSASSYSRSSSSYRSSSCSYHRRRRITYNSSRSSSSYTYSASDYSRSSRSYSRSRSTSRRRHWHSLSFSRSRSSSRSRTPPHHRFGGRVPRHRDRSNWRSQAASKQPRVESATTQQAKPPTQPPKLLKDKAKTDAASETKNSSCVSEPAGAPREPSDSVANSTEVKESTPVSSKEESKVATGPAEDVKSIPTPEEHMQSIPLPVVEHPKVSSNHSFIGPVLPSNHPLAHKQDIRLPPTAKFQRIGPNDPLVFRSMPPPPPPPASLTSHGEDGKGFVPPPRPPSPPADDMEDDIAGDEDPIPQMLDVKTLKPTTFIPPEQDEQYGALRRQAELHARRQRIREETGMDIADEEDDEGTESVQEEELGDQLYLDDTVAAAESFAATPVLHLPHQHLVGQPLSSSVAMMTPGSGLVPIQVVPAAGRGVVGIEPSLVQLVAQNQTPTILAVSPAAAALARAQEEAEAEAQLRQQVAAAQAIVSAQRQRAAAELVQLLPGHLIANSASLATLRPTGLPLQAIPVHAIAGQQPQQQLIRIPTGRIVGVPNAIPGGMQVIAQPQPQAHPAPVVIGPNGTILRLIR